MKIHFLGTCAGTAPMPDRHHASFTITVKDRVYWFDAGEGCSFTAHNLGVDILSVNKIVISHTHMDHIGGLANLLWNIRKLTFTKKSKTRFDVIDLYLPVLESYEGIMMLLKNTEGNYKKDFEICAHKTNEGVLFDDGFMRVTAVHNTHLARQETDMPLSFSFLIETEDKKIVYSGDIGDYCDLDELLSEPVDMLITETGHFTVQEVFDYTRDKEIDKIIYFHNGGEILRFPEESLQKVEKLHGGRAVVSYDGMVIDF